jgi:transposase InsO family protein
LCLASIAISVAEASGGTCCPKEKCLRPDHRQNARYKAEIIHRRGPWRSLKAVEFATLEWVDWFNNRRLLEPIGNIPPAEAEERYYAMLEQPAMAA